MTHVLLSIWISKKIIVNYFTSEEDPAIAS
jgi:hypothetical protein